jgi:hypothetical protein
MRIDGFFASEYRARENVKRAKAEHMHPGAEYVSLGQCGCSHWGADHCLECGACQKCQCNEFKGE